MFFVAEVVVVVLVAEFVAVALDAVVVFVAVDAVLVDVVVEEDDVVVVFVADGVVDVVDAVVIVVFSAFTLFVAAVFVCVVGVKVRESVFTAFVFAKNVVCSELNLKSLSVCAELVEAYRPLTPSFVSNK